MKSEFRIFLSTGVSGDSAGLRVCMNKRGRVSGGREKGSGEGGQGRGGKEEEEDDAPTFMGMFQAM